MPTDRDFILSLQEQIRQHIGGSVPVDPLPPGYPPVVNPTPPSNPDFPAGPILGEGVSTWFRSPADYFTIDNPGGALEIVLANLNEAATISVLTVDGREISRTFIGGGGINTVSPAGPVRVKVESVGIGIVKYWRR